MIQPARLLIVDDEDAHVADLEHRRLGYRRCPGAAIDIAAHRGDRREARQRGEDFGIADIAGMDDGVAAAQRRHGTGAELPVRVGDQPDNSGVAGWHFSAIRSCMSI